MPGRRTNQPPPTARPARGEAPETEWIDNSQYISPHAMQDEDRLYARNLRLSTETISERTSDSSPVFDLPITSLAHRFELIALAFADSLAFTSFLAHVCFPDPAI